MRSRSLFFLTASILTAAVILAYSNHFEGGFHFDDSHVIEQNIHIRSLGNIPRFFTDAATFSALPANQSYRPLLTTLFALEYWAGGGNPIWFHLSSCLWYMVLWMLVFILFRMTFSMSLASPPDQTRFAALLGSAFYLLHAANAETVNYISARSDLLSTLFMVASLVLYIARPNQRKFGFYLVPAGLAMLVKEVSVIFPLLLFSYVLLFEKQILLTDLLSVESRKRLKSAFVMILPACGVCLSLAMLSARMLPKTYTPSVLSRTEYILAQPFVIVHYYNSFLLPFNLSADTDWKPIGIIFDDRVLVGAAFIVLLAAAAMWASRESRTRPIGFGIAWFLMGVLPTSSGIVPLAEVLNDHRMFLPFIGLAMAASWSFVLLVERYDSLFHGGRVYRAGVAVLVAGIMAGHAYGTYQRNKVWRDEESLWFDVTRKNPGNSRGLMNYGLACMAKGDILDALDHFERALLISPDYAYLHINSAITLDALGETAVAESRFKKAIESNPGYFECYHYYARFLQQHNRLPEAISLLGKAVELSPGFSESRYLLMRIHTRHRDWRALGEIVEDSLRRSPDDAVARSYHEIVLNAGDPVKVRELAAVTDPTPESYLWLSLAYCEHSQFKKCIDAHFELARNNLEMARGLE